MKKVLSVIFVLCMMLSLAACGGKAKEANVDVAAVYDSYKENLPEMLEPDEDTLLNFMGIQVSDCRQYKVAICAEGLRADEVWLIEAKDDAAMKNLTELAEMRIQSKLDETETYTPDQFLIVQKAEIVTKGNFLALLISPDVDTLKAGFEAAFNG